MYQLYINKMFNSVVVTTSYNNTSSLSSWLSSSHVNNIAFEGIQTSKDNLIIAENIHTRWLSTQAVSKQ